MDHFVVHYKANIDFSIQEQIVGKPPNRYFDQAVERIWIPLILGYK